MKAILDYFSAMLPYALSALPIGIIWRLAADKKLKAKGMNVTGEHDVISIIFLMFIIALASQTILPNFSEISLEEVYKGLERVNLIPFKEIKIAFKLGGKFFLVNFIGNIIMFLPIAYFVGLLYNKPSFVKCVFITTAVSVIVETCQLPQNRGTDIDDVILNTVGGIIGYVLYLVTKEIFPGFEKRCKIG